MTAIGIGSPDGAADDAKVLRKARRRLVRGVRNREAALLLFAWILTVGMQVLVQLAGVDTIPPGTLSFALVVGALFLIAHLAVRRFAPLADPIVLPGAALLAGIGYAMITRLDIELSTAQGTWIAIGVAAFVVVIGLLRDYRALDRYRYSALFAGLVLLLLPLAPGIGRVVNGSRLWIDIGPLSFQPGEIAKILLVVFFASYLAENRELIVIPTRKVAGIGIPDFRHFGPMLAAWGLSLVVMLAERDLGSSLLLFAVFVAIMFAATGRIAYVVAGSGLFVAGSILAYQLFGHVQARVEGWLDPFNARTVTGGTFQIAQSLFALAAGDTFGTGLGLGRPTQIPAVSTDFVFAAIGEELGFVGSVAVILLYVLLVGAGLRIALRCPTPFGKLLAVGLTTTLGMQAFIIIGGVTRLIPLTGITLPFVSYGGSSIVSNFIIVGLLLAVSDQSVSGPRGHSFVLRRKPLELGDLVT